MTSGVMQMTGERNAPVQEFDPAEYVASIREFLLENPSSVLRVNPPEVVRLQMQAETEKSEALVGQEQSHLTSTFSTPEEVALIGENFPGLMARVIKLSANANRHGAPIKPLGEFEEASQDEVRERLFQDYVDLCAVLSGKHGRISKTACQSSAVLYYSPARVRQLLEENEDLDRTNVTRIIAEKPVSAEAAMERARETVEATIERFPTIAHSVIRTCVVKAPETYESQIRKYAEEHGIALDAAPGEVPAPEDFLQTLRKLLRGPDYSLQGLRPPAEFTKVARKLGQEAVALMDETNGGLPQDEHLREGFRRKTELFALASNRAWRRGDLTVTPDQTPEEFRKALYARLLDDFLKIHVELSGDGPSTYSKSIDANPVLYYGAEEIERIVENNSDLPKAHIRTLIARHPDRPEEAIEEFRSRIEQVMQTHPRLMQYEARRVAIRRSDSEALTGYEAAADKLSPGELIETVRAHLKEDVHIHAVSEDIKRQIEELRGEITELFEEANWTFAGIELPKAGQTMLLKKIEEFIAAQGRVYRVKGDVPRIQDYTAEERLAIYELLAENYARCAEVFKPRTAKDWKTTPVLYIDAGELAQLRAKHGSMTDWSFRRVLERGYKNPAAAFERFDVVKSELERLYPGLSQTQVRRLALERPASARKTAMDIIRRDSETAYARTASSQTEPNPQKPKRIRKHLQTLIRYDRTPKHPVFDKETEDRIAVLRGSAAAWVAGQETAGEIEDKVLNRFLGQVEYYTRVSVALNREDGYPSILDMPAHNRSRFVKAMYDNQLDIRKLVGNGNGNSHFRVYAFGFFHDASYLKSLHKQYAPYMPEALISFVALKSARRPFESLNELVEYRAELLLENPDLSPDQLNKALLAKVKDA